MPAYGGTSQEDSSMKMLKSYASIQSFASYIGRYKLRLAIVFIGFLIADAFVAIIPVFIGKLVGAASKQPVNSHQVYHYVIVLIVCSLGHNFMWRLSEFMYLKLLNPLGYSYENILFKTVIRKPYPFFVDKFTGKVSSYITTLSQEFRDQLEKLFWDYANHIVSLVITIAVVTVLNWETGVIFMCGLALMVIVGRHTVKNSIKYEKIWTDVQSTKNGKIIDAIANFVNVKSFQKEAKESQTIVEEQDKTIAASNRSFIWSMIFWGSMGFFVRDFIWPITILINVYLFLHHQISLADLTTFLSALALFVTYIWDIVWNFSQVTLKLARAEEAHTYLFGKTNITKEYYRGIEQPAPALDYNEILEFNHLHFAYPDKPDLNVLHSIDLKILKGQKIGVVGKSGSGKTTITKLLLGYYPVDKDEILLDGQKIDNRELSQLISYVPQDTSLFHRSIADNIAYATDKDVTREDIVEAAKKAHVHEFVEKISEGYDALVGERGVKLSAGQRQRIAIARAFLDDKPILILDEATSALDSESELLVQEALEALWYHKTVIAIAHRLSTLRNMDKIVVLDKGKIIEYGSHEELLLKKGKYSELWAHQSGGFLEE
jgi:ATP-binding cassette subfamily B protein